MHQHFHTLVSHSLASQFWQEHSDSTDTLTQVVKDCNLRLSFHNFLNPAALSNRLIRTCSLRVTTYQKVVPKQLDTSTIFFAWQRKSSYNGIDLGFNAPFEFKFR